MAGEMADQESEGRHQARITGGPQKLFDAKGSYLLVATELTRVTTQFLLPRRAREAETLMGLYYDLHYELFEKGVWVSAPPRPTGNYFFCEPFLSVKVGQPVGGVIASLFFWPNSPLEFHKGVAEPLSDLCRHLMDKECLNIAWLPFESLFIDEWATENILVTSRVAHSFAAVFGDGLAPFPKAALEQMGMSEQDIQTLRYGYVTDHRISRVWGFGRHELNLAIAQANPHHLAVTWEDSIAELLGVDTASAFQALRNLGHPDRDIRIICSTS